MGISKLAATTLIAFNLLIIKSSNGNSLLDMTDIPSDRASILRGAEYVATTCNACHGLNLIQYQNLVELGISQNKVDTWRGKRSIESSILSPLSPEVAEAAFGIQTPDLSKITTERYGGVNYIYTYLMAYRVNNGVITNRIFPRTRMPDILGISAANSLQEQFRVSSIAKDISAFLRWTATQSLSKKTSEETQ